MGLKGFSIGIELLWIAAKQVCSSLSSLAISETLRERIPVILDMTHLRSLMFGRAGPSIWADSYHAYTILYTCASNLYFNLLL